MWRSMVLLSMAVILWGQSTMAEAEPLQVLYIEYPPYYYTSADGTPRGLVVDIARKVFAMAGVECAYEYAPSKRVLSAMREGQPVASLGWFKTAEREEFARFSLPVYVNLPLHAAVLRQHSSQFLGYSTLHDLLASGRFVVGRIDGHSYGDAVDLILDAYPRQSVFVAADQERLLTMLEAERFDFLLLAPEEVAMQAKAVGLSTDDLVLLPLRDIPAGNARHIMYSKSVDPEIIRKIDQVLLSQAH